MTAREDLDRLEHELNAVLLKVARLLKRHRHFLSIADESDGDLGDQAPAAPSAPQIHGTVVLPPKQPELEAGTLGPVVANIHGTCWLNGSDDRSGETAKQPMYAWAPRNFKGCGLTTVGVAVPMKVQKGDGVRVRLSSGNDNWVYFPIIEGGPHRTSDLYLITGKRPLAEEADTNRAGIDFTPAALALLNGHTAQENYDSEPSVTVDVQFVPAGHPHAPLVPAPAPAHHNAMLGVQVVAAARALPDPFPYAPETDHGRLGCADVVSTALVHAGVMRGVVLSVDAVVTELVRIGWADKHPPVAYADGDVIIFAATEDSRGHKHVGILAHDASGDLTVINNSSSRERVVEQKMSAYQRPIERVLAPP